MFRGLFRRSKPTPASASRSANAVCGWHDSTSCDCRCTYCGEFCEGTCAPAQYHSRSGWGV